MNWLLVRELIELVGAGRGKMVLMGMIALEKSSNAVSEGCRITAISEESDFCGGVREGSVNNESAEIIW